MNNRFGDWDESNTRGLPCVSCAWVRAGAVCVAFPDGITAQILSGDNDHRRPYPGDHGIRYAPNESQRHYLAEIDEDTPG